jgi:hypothetical protein
MNPYEIRTLPIVKKVSTERVPLSINVLYKLFDHSIKYFVLVMEECLWDVNICP